MLHMWARRHRLARGPNHRVTARPDRRAAACSRWVAAVVVGHGLHPVGGLVISQSRTRSVSVMLRPASWTELAGESPVPVGTGAPGSRPRFVVEKRRAKRGVKSLFGGSKCAGRSAIRRESCSLVKMYNVGAEPLMSRRRPCPSSPGPGSAWRVLPGYGERHVHIVQSGTGEARLPSLRRAKTKGISRW